MAVSNPVWQPYVETEMALKRVEHDLASSPDDAGTLFERARLLDKLGHSDTARQAYLEVLARDFCHEGALVGLGALLFSEHFTSAARTVFDRAIFVNPANLAARVCLGNLLRLAGQPDLARSEYEAALQIDPTCREAHQGLSYILDEVDDALADYHRRCGFAGYGVITSSYRGQLGPITVLRFVSAHGGNVPLSEIFDDRIFLVHTLVAEFAQSGLNFPPHDVVFNAIGDVDRCAGALGKLPPMLSRTTAPVINPPERVLLTARVLTYLHLASLCGVIVPKCLEVSKESAINGSLSSFSFPYLLRSPGFHTGQHFGQVHNSSELPDALAQLPGNLIYAIEYFNTRTSDSFFRKYRVMLIGGELFPLHLAISTQWKVHYFTANMENDDAFRMEEARFLADMPAVLGPVALKALNAIQTKLGLDYAGVDFALSQDGRIIVFEANATMTIVSPPAGSMWDYRRPATQRAINAAQALIRESMVVTKVTY